ncbi:DUF515 domain-containing protein [Pyrococcus horikoshii]|uniref:DUF515 domain-containing protein n=1 Tax=Pyrococcus horikoshii TaxID=53953 RepID=A0A832T643_PYRHR|nr:DUF515 domain-containing protein [Pyrococcus horikoshii]HII60833.1 DUF515 domain-containing protein [Pyrococcus horikoshii]
MAEDIEEKIRRLRELGRAAAETEEQPPTPGPPKPPRRRVSRIGMFRERERRKRIIIGALVLTIVIVGAVISIYTYLESKAARELENAKKAKIAEVNKCFTGELANDTVKVQLINKILAAKSVKEVQSINVKAICEKRLQEIREAKRRAEEEKRLKELEALKNQTKENIKLAFEPLLQVRVPDELKAEIVSTLNALLAQVDAAKTKDEVLSISPDEYLLNLWKKVYFYRIDSIPTKDVILKRGTSMNIYTKEEAKEIIGKIGTLSELLQYSVKEVEFVQVALVLPRDSVVGGFLEPGDKIKIYARSNGTKFEEIVPEGRVSMVLFAASKINLYESETKTTSVSSSSSTTSQQSSLTNYAPGAETNYQTSQTSQTQASTTQTSSETISASYSYSVDLSEILKAIAAGKINDPEKVKAELEKYGWKVLDLERETNLMALPKNTEVLVLVEVPKDFVPKLLTYESSVVIAKITG